MLNLKQLMDIYNRIEWIYKLYWIFNMITGKTNKKDIIIIMIISWHKETIKAGQVKTETKYFVMLLANYNRNTRHDSYIRYRRGYAVMIWCMILIIIIVISTTHNTNTWRNYFINTTYINRWIRILFLQQKHKVSIKSKQ